MIPVLFVIREGDDLELHLACGHVLRRKVEPASHWPRRKHMASRRIDLRVPACLECVATAVPGRTGETTSPVEVLYLGGRHDKPVDFDWLRHYLGI